MKVKLHTLTIMTICLLTSSAIAHKHQENTPGRFESVDLGAQIGVL